MGGGGCDRVGDAIHWFTHGTRLQYLSTIDVHYFILLKEVDATDYTKYDCMSYDFSKHNWTPMTRFVL